MSLLSDKATLDEETCFAPTAKDGHTYKMNYKTQDAMQCDLFCHSTVSDQKA